MPSGLTSTSSSTMGARRTSAASLEKGWEESPWKERVQSTGDFVESGGGRSRGSSERPWVREEVVGLLVAFRLLEDGDGGEEGEEEGDEELEAAVAGVARRWEGDVERSRTEEWI